MLSDDKISIRWKIPKPQQNASMTKQGNANDLQHPWEIKIQKGNGRIRASWLGRANTILTRWPVFPAAALIRPINNQHKEHLLPQLNKGLDQYRISSNPLIWPEFNRVCSVVMPPRSNTSSPVARRGDECHGSRSGKHTGGWCET